MLKQIARQIPQIDRLVRSRDDLGRHAKHLEDENALLRLERDRLQRRLDHFEHAEKLIFDVGMHHGRDTEFYLLKGFRVVAVEANPLLAGSGRKKFAEYIRSGQLVIVEAGIWHTRGTINFYRNLDHDDWSSFRRENGTRQGTRYDEIEVECITTADLFARFGVPYYIKIDVEGVDSIIVKDMASLGTRPAFVSAEEYGIDIIRDMAQLGYDRFQIVPQAAKWLTKPPQPPLEGAYVERQFNGHDSGLFGRELPYGWMDVPAAEQKFFATVRDRDSTRVAPEGEWYDVHATRSSTC